MPPMHENTTLDPIAESMALVKRFEEEATDEDMMAGLCMMAQQAFHWREQVARERLMEAQKARTLDNRRERLRAKLKGVVHAEPEQRVQLAAPGQVPQPPVIASKR